MLQVAWFIFYPLLLISLTSYLVLTTSLKITLQKNWKIILLFSFFLFLFLDSFTIWHMSQEHFIYYWDFSGFWRRQIEVMGLFNSNPSQLFSMVYQSILTNEYSSFPQLLLIPHVSLVGVSYPRFILAMVNMFLIPSQILFFVWMLNLIEKWGYKNNYSTFLLAIFLILFTGNLLPLLLGYVGSGGQFFILIVLILLFESDFKHIHFHRFLVISFSLLILIFLRRWYAYFIVSFYVIYPLSYVIDQFIKRDFNIKYFINMLISFFISGLAALLVLILGFSNLFITFTNYDYSYAYQSVYTGLEAAWPWFVNFYSPLQVFFMLIGVLFGLFHSKTRLITLFSSLAILFVIFMFYQVQILGSHHYYIINVMSQILILIGFFFTLEYLKHKYLRLSLILSISFLMFGNFSLTFLKYGNSIHDFFLSHIQPFSTKVNAPPRTNPDVEVIQDIVFDLQELAKEYEYIYVLSGSSHLNDDMLRNALLPEQYNPLPTIEGTRQLDTRDGLPVDFFNYTYIIVADPIQYHNGAAYQHVIGDLALGILHDEKLREYYYLHKTYELSGDITVYLYQRINDIPEDLKEEYRQIYKDIYPDNPELYQFN